MRQGLFTPKSYQIKSINHINKHKKMASITFEKITLNWEKTEYTSFPNLAGVYQIYGLRLYTALTPYYILEKR